MIQQLDLSDLQDMMKDMVGAEPSNTYSKAYEGIVKKIAMENILFLD